MTPTDPRHPFFMRQFSYENTRCFDLRVDNAVHPPRIEHEVLSREEAAFREGLEVALDAARKLVHVLEGRALDAQVRTRTLAAHPAGTVPGEQKGGRFQRDWFQEGVIDW